MTTVLFAPQNDSHAETVALLQPELQLRGVESVVLDLDGIYHQGTARHLQGVATMPSSLTTDRPFYRLSPRAQLSVVAAARRALRHSVDDVHGVVAFNDGAIQRLLFARARARRLPTDLILDGMITFLDQPFSVRWAARRALQELGRSMDGTDLGAFLPSEVGLTGTDRTHVGGEHSAAVLRARRSRARSILASGLPRWPDPEWLAPARVERVLYLTGAFRWHGDPAMARAQELDARVIASVCENLALPLVIRVHPRDDAESYRGLPAVILDPRSESMTESIRRSDLVLSIVSTGLIEGIVLGKPTRVVAIHPDSRRYRRSFVSDPLFRPVRAVDDLRAVLTSLAGRVDPGDLESQRARLAPYVAATGKDATRAIADAISGHRGVGPRVHQEPNQEGTCEF